MNRGSKKTEEKVLRFLEDTFKKTSKTAISYHDLAFGKNGKPRNNEFKIAKTHNPKTLIEFGVIGIRKFKKEKICVWISNETPEQLLHKYLNFVREKQRKENEKYTLKRKEKERKLIEESSRSLFDEENFTSNNKSKVIFKQKYDDEIIPSELHNDIVYSLKNNFIDQDEKYEKNNKTDLIEVLNTLNKNIINLNKTLEKIIAIEKEKHEITD